MSKTYKLRRIRRILIVCALQCALMTGLSIAFGVSYSMKPTSKESPPDGQQALKTSQDAVVETNRDSLPNPMDGWCTHSGRTNAKHFDTCGSNMYTHGHKYGFKLVVNDSCSSGFRCIPASRTNLCNNMNGDNYGCCLDYFDQCAGDVISDTSCESGRRCVHHSTTDAFENGEASCHKPAALQKHYYAASTSYAARRKLSEVSEVFFACDDPSFDPTTMKCPASSVTGFGFFNCTNGDATCMIQSIIQEAPNIPSPIPSAPPPPILDRSSVDISYASALGRNEFCSGVANIETDTFDLVPYVQDFSYNGRIVITDELERPFKMIRYPLRLDSTQQEKIQVTFGDSTKFIVSCADEPTVEGPLGTSISGLASTRTKPDGTHYSKFQLVDYKNYNLFVVCPINIPVIPEATEGSIPAGLNSEIQTLEDKLDAIEQDSLNTTADVVTLFPALFNASIDHCLRKKAFYYGAETLVVMVQTDGVRDGDYFSFYSNASVRCYYESECPTITLQQFPMTLNKSGEIFCSPMPPPPPSPPPSPPSPPSPFPPPSLSPNPPYENPSPFSPFSPLSPPPPPPPPYILGGPIRMSRFWVFGPFRGWLQSPFFTPVFDVTLG